MRKTALLENVLEKQNLLEKQKKPTLDFTALTNDHRIGSR
jgi:hypothetical protein